MALGGFRGLGMMGGFVVLGEARLAALGVSGGAGVCDCCCRGDWDCGWDCGCGCGCSSGCGCDDEVVLCSWVVEMEVGLDVQVFGGCGDVRDG